MKYLSVCSGIEAATVAWHPLGWQPVAFGEIEKFPCQVLEHHYPDTPNWGDMTKFKEWPDADVNVFVGGTPCQSFSVAGLRKGLDDPRGNLMLTYLAIAARYRPQWLVWENVPGVLSSNGGLDFASLLRGMGELGYGFAYRILDAQYFGVAQRRRRVFVVGYLGNWRPAAAVLFERHSLSGHPAPSRKAREGAAATITTRTRVSRNNHKECVTWPAEVSSTLDTTFGAKMGLENQHVNAGFPMFVPAQTFSTPAIGSIRKDVLASCITKNTGGGGETQNPAFVLQPMQPAYGIPGNWIGRKPENGGNATEPMHDIAPCLTSADHHGVAQPIPLDMMNIRGRPSDDGRANRIGRGYGEVGDPMFTITKANHHAVAQPVHCVDMGGNKGLNGGGILRELSQPLSTNESHAIQQAMAVRRLTCVECERLQGFPDNYTDIKPKGKATPDGPRYKALGNSMAVPVMAWIGKRIQEVDAICQTQKQ